MSYTYNDNYCGTLGSCPEPITMLGQAGSDDSFRTLIAATRTTIFSSNDHNGNWRVLADGLGGGTEDENDENCNTCSSRRFRMAQLGNYVLFTNDFDPVLAWKYGDPPTGLNLWSAQYVEDLLVVGITKARCITEYNGFMIVGNVDVEGVHRGSRIYWSDYNAPISWIPSLESFAGYQEFSAGEKVLRLEQLGRYLMVYTDRRIYQGVFVGGDQVFQFTPIATDNPLVYEFSLVNKQDAHIFGSHNGIYVATASDPRPQRYEWMHLADGAIYSGVNSAILGGFVGMDPFGPINQEQCGQFIGGYDPVKEEVWFSWPTQDEDCPNMSLALNLRYSAADLVDYGFTAFASYKPDYRPTVRDWLNSEGVCPVSISDFVKEGLPLDTDGGDAPLYIWNETENPLATIHPDSWCARLNGTTEPDLCDDCDASPAFLSASASDYTIKEWNDEVFTRTEWDNNLLQYAASGYYTLLQSDMSEIGTADEKIIKQVLWDYVAEDQEPPSNLVAEVGFGSQPRCARWVSLGERELKCLTEKDEEQHIADNTRPDLAAKFQSWRRGRYIGHRVYIEGVGGSCCFSRAVLSISKAQGRTH